MRACHRPLVIVALLVATSVFLGAASSAVAGDRTVLGEVFSGLG